MRLPKGCEEAGDPVANFMLHFVALQRWGKVRVHALEYLQGQVPISGVESFEQLPTGQGNHFP
jgi:hypothetical protein